VTETTSPLQAQIERFEKATETLKAQVVEAHSSTKAIRAERLALGEMLHETRSLLAEAKTAVSGVVTQALAASVVPQLRAETEAILTDHAEVVARQRAQVAEFHQEVQASMAALRDLDAKRDLVAKLERSVAVAGKLPRGALGTEVPWKGHPGR